MTEKEPGSLKPETTLQEKQIENPITRDAHIDDTQSNTENAIFEILENDYRNFGDSRINQLKNTTDIHLKHLVDSNPDVRVIAAKILITRNTKRGFLLPIMEHVPELREIALDQFQIHNAPRKSLQALVRRKIPICSELAANQLLKQDPTPKTLFIIIQYLDDEEILSKAKNQLLKHPKLDTLENQDLLYLMKNCDEIAFAIGNILLGRKILDVRRSDLSYAEKMKLIRKTYISQSQIVDVMCIPQLRERAWRLLLEQEKIDWDLIGIKIRVPEFADRAVEELHKRFARRLKA